MLTTNFRSSNFVVSCSFSLSLSSPGLHFQYAVSFVSRVLFSSDLKNYAVFISTWCFLRLLLFSSLALCKLTFSSVDSVMVRFLCKYLRMLTKFVLNVYGFFSVSATFPHRCCCAWIFFLSVASSPLCWRHATAIHFSIALSMYSICEVRVCCVRCFFGLAAWNIVFIHCVCVPFSIVFSHPSHGCTLFIPLVPVVAIASVLLFTFAKTDMPWFLYCVLLMCSVI